MENPTMRTLFCIAITLSVATPLYAQQATTPAAQVAPPVSAEQQVPQSQADVEWLTAYMLAHEGYQLNHMPALEKTFEKMSPTQLRTLREFYEQKHEMVMRQTALIHQLQAQQVNMAQEYHQRQQQALDEFTREQSLAAESENERINRMHEQAAANAAAERLYGPHIYPSPIYGRYYWPYGGPRYPY
jgi:hypothetical protein